MVSIVPSAEVVSGGALSGAVRPRRWWRVSPFRAIVWLVAALFFLTPIVAGLKFSLQAIDGSFSFSPIAQIGSENGLPGSLWLSFRLAIVTVVISLALMVPTVVYVHLRVPGVRRILDTVTLLPIIIPPIVLVLGIADASPLWLRQNVYLLSLIYVILAMPFMYRALDNGLAAMDLKTLVEASKSLGAGMTRTITRVIVPNMRGAIISGVVFTVALVMSEFTMAVLLFPSTPTLPVWVADFWQTDGHVTVAVSMMSLVGSWVLLSLIVSFNRSGARKRKRSQT